MPTVQKIPDGLHTVTPHLVVKGASDAIAFYTRAFGATELSRMPAPDGKLMHASIRIGDSVVFLVDEFPEYGSCGPIASGGRPPVSIHLYVDDADALYARAVQAGATATMPVADMFWGDRYGQLTDPFGHVWSIATHTRDLTPEQMHAEMKKMMPG
jgi:uncharacterized glyoxalase superfamily protein PhnB